MGAGFIISIERMTRVRAKASLGSYVSGLFSVAKKRKNFGDRETGPAAVNLRPII
jgi:hypothetical protein